MRDHILVDRAFRFPATPPPDPVGCFYRRDIGVWVTSDDPSRPMVDPAPPRPPGDGDERPRPRPRPQSKKMDQETGEDMKGA